MDTTKIPGSFVLDIEIKEEQIRRLKEFILKRFPHALVDKLVITYSTKKPMQLVALGPQKGEIQILLANGSDFIRKFLNTTYFKQYLGPPS